MQPRPIAETSKPDLPSVRRCMLASPVSKRSTARVRRKSMRGVPLEVNPPVWLAGSILSSRRENVGCGRAQRGPPSSRSVGRWASLRSTTPYIFDSPGAGSLVAPGLRNPTLTRGDVACRNDERPGKNFKRRGAVGQGHPPDRRSPSPQPAPPGIVGSFLAMAPKLLEQDFGGKADDHLEDSSTSHSRRRRILRQTPGSSIRPPSTLAPGGFEGRGPDRLQRIGRTSHGLRLPPPEPPRCPTSRRSGPGARWRSASSWRRALDGPGGRYASTGALGLARRGGPGEGPARVGPSRRPGGKRVFDASAAARTSATHLEADPIARARQVIAECKAQLPVGRGLYLHLLQARADRRQALHAPHHDHEGQDQAVEPLLQVHPAQCRPRGDLRPRPEQRQDHRPRRGARPGRSPGRCTSTPRGAWRWRRTATRSPRRASAR